MKKIAFVRTRYLPPSETFIYEELKNITTVKPIVFARKKMNLNRFPYSNIKKLSRGTNYVIKKFQQEKIKLIHARFGNAGVRLMEVKRRTRLPMLTSFHGFDLPAKRSRKNLYHRKLPRLFRIGDRFTVPSFHMRQKLIQWGCPPNKINVMYSGIDLKKFTYIKRDLKTENVVIMAVGRLHKKKGFRYLIKAFKQVADQYPTSRLIIVGEGAERGKLTKLISAFNLKKYVKLTGIVTHSQMSAMLSRADIFCLPSVTTKEGNQEGIPNAIKEAMATGLPIVSTLHGGIPELVANESEGLLVPEKNVKLLAEKIMYLIENPSLRSEMGERGRTKVENHFDSSKQVSKLESIYKQLMGDNK